VRFGFIICVRLGESCIEELAAFGANLVYLGSLHDEIARKKSGRVYLDGLAQRLDVPLTKFRNINDHDAVESIREAELDWLYLIGWSQIARSHILTTPTRGVIGMHPTLLPKGRGRASIPWAILKGLTETGVSMFQLDEGTDTGPLLGQVRVPIAPDETSTSLYDKIAEAHRTLIRDVHQPLAEGQIAPVAQDNSLATEWPGRSPEDGSIIRTRMTVSDVDRLVRASTHPYPGAYVVEDAGGVVRVWAGQQTEPVGASYEIHTVDGSYWATDFARDS